MILKKLIPIFLFLLVLLLFSKTSFAYTDKISVPTDTDIKSFGIGDNYFYIGDQRKLYIFNKSNNVNFVNITSSSPGWIYSIYEHKSDVAEDIVLVNGLNDGGDYTGLYVYNITNWERIANISTGDDNSVGVADDIYIYALRVNRELFFFNRTNYYQEFVTNIGNDIHGDCINQDKYNIYVCGYTGNYKYYVYNKTNRANYYNISFTEQPFHCSSDNFTLICTAKNTTYIFNVTNRFSIINNYSTKGILVNFTYVLIDNYNYYNILGTNISVYNKTNLENYRNLRDSGVDFVKGFGTEGFGKTSTDSKYIWAASTDNYMYKWNITGGGEDEGEKNITIRTFNEKTEELIFFNITISNSTDSKTWYNIDGTFANETLPTGEIIIKIFNVAYKNRYYYKDSERPIIFDAYLLKSDEGSIIHFYVKETGAKQDPIPNALIDAKRKINNTWVTIGQKKTDDTGTGTIFLDQEESYYIYVSKSGYIPESKYITPTESGYNFYLDSTTGINVSFSYLWDDVFYSLTPTIILDNSSKIDFTIRSYNKSLEYYGLVIYCNETLFFEDELNDNKGGNITAIVNLTNMTNTYINITAYFKKSEYDRIDINLYTMVIDHELYNQSGVWGLKDTIQTIPPPARLIVAIFISMLLIGGLSAFGIGIGGSGLIIMVFLGFLTIVGWFEGMPYWIPLYTLFILTMLSVYIIKANW